MKCTFFIAQINPCVGDITGNADKIRAAWHSAPAGAMVLLPEMALVGYPSGDMLLRCDFLDRVQQAVEALVQESIITDAALLLTCPWRQEGHVYNAALLIADGQIQGTAYKHHLPCYGVFEEPRWFTPGSLAKPIAWRDMHLGILICEDMWHSGVAQHLTDKGANHLIVLNASPFEGPNKHKNRLVAAKKQVKTTHVPLTYVNLVGGQDNLVFDGGSFALNAAGDVTFQAPFFEEGFFNASFAFVGKTEEETALLYKALVLATKDYVCKNGFTDVLLGLSGGVDSALVSAIAADALGPEHVHALILPTRFTSKQSLKDATELAKFLHITYEEISIEIPLCALEKLVRITHGPAHENLQARLRGMILMAQANARPKTLVLATGNKSELAVGYCTLYGDMCGGFAPLGDVYKTRVWDLARYRGLPKSIIDRPPTAELRDNQCDQDTLPPYDVLDAILQELIERDGPPVDTMGEYIQKMLLTAEHKRRQAPPAPKVTARALRDDRRWPVTSLSLSPYSL